MSDKLTFTSLVFQIMRMQDAFRVYGTTEEQQALTDAAKILAYHAAKEQHAERVKLESEAEMARAKREAGL